MFITPSIDPASRDYPGRTGVSNGILGMMIFIFTEMMFFAALISAYLVIRAGLEEWPPWGQPRLPVEATAFNTFVLLLSGIILFQSHKVFDLKDLSKTKKLLGISIGLGTFFVLFQGYEWLSLISFGLTVTSSTYGSLFYLLIGAHAIHVTGALFGLFYVYWRIANADSRPLTRQEYMVPQLFWYFVVGVWPILYLLVYLL